MKFNSYCLNSFLTFRYIVDKNQYWKSDIKPTYPNVSINDQIGVKNASEVYDILKSLTKIDASTGIFLSGGIDSAILASFLPKKSKAYTIRFIADGAIDESQMAALYAEKMGLDLKVIEVHWEDYKELSAELMLNKKAPLHATEVAMFKAAKIAKDDGINTLIVGNGADSTFGGMDKLMSKDWTFDEFINRYSFINPKLVLKDTVSLKSVYEAYKTKNGIDVQGFLKVVHGIGIIQTFENSIHSAACKILAPYESIFLDDTLDIERIRNGESKYILREVFKKIYPDIDIPEKIPFARPMDQWLKDWGGPKRPEFKDNLNLDQFTGDQKWLIYNLEEFLDLIEQ